MRLLGTMFWSMNKFWNLVNLNFAITITSITLHIEKRFASLCCCSKIFNLWKYLKFFRNPHTFLNLFEYYSHQNDSQKRTRLKIDALEHVDKVHVRLPVSNPLCYRKIPKNVFEKQNNEEKLHNSTRTHARTSVSQDKRRVQCKRRTLCACANVARNFFNALWVENQGATFRLFVQNRKFALFFDHGMTANAQRQRCRLTH